LSWLPVKHNEELANWRESVKLFVWPNNGNFCLIGHLARKNEVLKALTTKNNRLLAVTPFSLEKVTTTFRKWHHIL